MAAANGTPAAPEVTPDKTAFKVTAAVLAALFGALIVLYFVWGFGLPRMGPTANASQAANALGIALILLGVVMTLTGFIAAISLMVANVWGARQETTAREAAMDAVTALITASAAVLKEPAGAGIIVMLVGTILLVGVAFATGSTPDASSVTK